LDRTVQQAREPLDASDHPRRPEVQSGRSALHAAITPSTASISVCQFVDLHTHPYAETFVLLEGHGRWTAGDDVIEASAESIISVPPDTLHGFRNIGQEPLLLVSVHESPTLVQGFTDRAPV
jgi:quercetin dioxygenase-like cupin family protein